MVKRGIVSYKEENGFEITRDGKTIRVYGTAEAEREAREEERRLQEEYDGR